MKCSILDIRFNPEIWGTVPDWFMVIVTAVTAYFLYRTLQEQKEFTKIELERFSRENPPTFASDRSIGNANKRLIYPLGFHVRVTNNRLKNLVINGKFPDGFKLIPSPSPTGSVPPEHEIFIMLDAPSTTDIVDCTGEITFEYDDMINNRYCQVLSLSRGILSWKPPYKI